MTARAALHLTPGRSHRQDLDLTSGAPALLGSVQPSARDGATVEWSRFIPHTLAEGPGERAALWLQGCSVHCPGCFNPQLWAPFGGIIESTQQIAARMVAETRASGSRGITLLGGEPFDQAAASAIIAEAFQAAGLSVMTFTGYPYERLLEWSAERPDFARLLAATDLLADGPYLRDRPDARRPWIGSTNQGLRALTPVYAEEMDRIAADGGTDRLEIRIRATGEVEVNGWAQDSVLEALFDDLGPRSKTAGKRPAQSAPAQSAPAPLTEERTR